MDYKSIVQKIWNTEVEGYKMYRVITKLRTLKKEFRKLNLEHFGDLKQKRDTVWRQLQDV